MTEEATVDILHEKEATAIICGHLCYMEDETIGFNVPADIKNDLQAWCDSCEKMLNKKGGWTDKMTKFANLRPCCAGCFVVLKRRMGF